MRFRSLIIVTLLFFVSALYATKTKKIEKSFSINPGQSIELETVSGFYVDVIAWDKPELKFDLTMTVKCSDKEFEAEYTDEFHIEEYSANSNLLIEFIELDEDQGWSFWDILKLKFHYSFEKRIVGQIYVPADNPVATDFRYGKIKVNGLKGEFKLDGRANELLFDECSNLNEIFNNYGDIIIRNCGGKLNLNSRSSKLRVDHFNGSVEIDAPYSEFKIHTINGDLNLSTRSAEVGVKNVSGNFNFEGNYSELDAENIGGLVSVVNRSGSVAVDDCGGIQIDAPYTSIEISNVMGTASDVIDISDRSGGIKITNAIGDLVIDDSYSNVGLKNITGNVHLESRSSTILVSNVKGNWRSDTKYCAYSIDKIYADSLRIENKSDDISIKFEKNPILTSITNDYGDVILTLPKNYTGDVELEAVHGSIKSDFAVKIKVQDNNSKIKGKIGSGNGKMKIITRSSDIELRERSM